MSRAQRTSMTAQGPCMLLMPCSKRQTMEMALRLFWEVCQRMYMAKYPLHDLPAADVHLY